MYFIGNLLNIKTYKDINHYFSIRKESEIIISPINYVTIIVYKVVMK
jgi:hypothetical protein